MRNNKPSICFVAHNAYGALAGVDNGHVGGIETQQSRMSCWFANNGYEVSMITWDDGYQNGDIVHGVKLFKLCCRNDGLPLIRFIHPRWTSLISALEQANADIYYYNCGDLALGQIAIWSKMNGKKLLYTLANEIDCYMNLPALKELRERILYRYGLRNSDAIVTQTRNQKNLLKEEYNLDSTVIPMPFFDVDLNNKIDSDTFLKNKKKVLWVGRITKVKRVELFLDLAEKMPQYSFHVAGAANDNSRYACEILSRMKNISNVVYHGRLLRHQVYDLYNESMLLCSTSIYEGFPNVYLEAWSFGLPLITTFDPDDVVSEFGMGQVVTNIDGLRKYVELFLSDSNAWITASNSAISYIRSIHVDSITMPLFEEAICRLYSPQGNRV